MTKSTGMGRGGARLGAGRKPLTPEERLEKKQREKAAAIMAATAKEAPPSLKISPTKVREIIARSRRAAMERQGRTDQTSPFRLPQFPPEAMPKDKKDRMAMDANPALGWAQSEYTNAGYPWSGELLGSASAEGLTFFNYPYLAVLAQRPEFRVISETIADDATRKWIDFEVTGSEDEKKGQSGPAEEGGTEQPDDPDERKKKIAAAGKTDKVKALRDEMERLEVRDKFYCISRDDGLFGRSHLFLQFGDDASLEDPNGELATDIGSGRDETSKRKVGKGSLKRIGVVEPIWVYPMFYNAVNPLKDDWYQPEHWYVMGTRVHRSRLPMFCAHPVPDLLKPAYSFGGLSMTQMARPYVDIWLRTKQSIAELIHSFSVMVLAIDMQTILQDGGELLARADLFNALRDNQNLFVINKLTETFANVSASLSGLHELQAQAQEHQAAVARIPLVKLTGISPSGLNATAEPEIRVYYDNIVAYQNRFFRPRLTKLINFMQLSLWGEIDPEITYDFEPLWETSEKEKADLQKAQAETRQLYIDMGVMAPEEVRKVIIDDPELPFTDLAPEDLPDLRSEEESGLEPQGGRPQPLGEAGPELGEQPDQQGKGGGRDDLDANAELPEPGGKTKPFKRTAKSRKES